MENNIVANMPANDSANNSLIFRTSESATKETVMHLRVCVTIAMLLTFRMLSSVIVHFGIQA